MSKRELQHMDPANVLETGSTRISRSGSAGQHHDPHGGGNCKGSVQPPLSPVISLASDLELSPPPYRYPFSIHPFPFSLFTLQTNN